MRRKPTDSPFQSGEWSKADLDKYACGKPVPVLWGLAFAIALAILAAMVVRYAAWLGRQ